MSEEAKDIVPFLVKELKPDIKNFYERCGSEKFLKSMPYVFQRFLLRDILYYTEEDIDKMDLKTEALALVYCETVFTQRNIPLILSRAFGGGGGKSPSSGKDGFGITVEQPEIEDWIREQYEMIEKETIMPEGGNP